MIQECIVINLITLLELVKVLLAYKVIFNYTFNKKKSILGLLIIVICTIQAITVYLISFDYHNIMIVSALFITLYYLEGRILKKIFNYVLVVLGIAIIDAAGSLGFSTIMNLSLDETLSNNMFTLVANSTGLILLLIIWSIKKIKNKDKKQSLQLTLIQYAVMGFGMLSFILLIAGSQMILLDMEFGRQGRTIWYISVLIAGLLFVVMSIWQSIVLRNENIYKEENKFYKKCLELQKNHIKAIIEKDKEMRKFRHDIHAHMTALTGYIHDEDFGKTKEYVYNMQQNIQLGEIKKYIGDTAVDAVINDIATYANNVGIKIIWSNNLGIDFKIETYELCVVFSNIIKNAMEACEKIEDLSKRIINVDVCKYNNKMYIHVSNPVNESVIIEKNNILKTSKSNSLNHGIGSYNVNKIVDKNNGLLTYKCENGIFHVEILI